MGTEDPNTNNDVHFISVFIPDPFAELVRLLCTQLPVSLHMSSTSPMATPSYYSGAVEECDGFIQQCKLFFEMQPNLFPTVKSKIAYVISLLIVKALSWARNELEAGSPLTATLSAFLHHRGI